MWLYIPQDCLQQLNCEEYRSVPASEVSTSACKSPSQSIELFVLSSGKLVQQPLSWRGWATRPWLQLLSGATCGPSMAALGVARFISSLPDIHASPSQARGEGREPPTPDISGPTSHGSRWKLRQSGSFVKTSKDTSIWDCPTSSQTYGRWATRQKRASFQRLKSARPTYGAESSFWPTPMASMGGNRTDIEFSPKGMRFRVATDQSGNQVSLETAGRVWSQMVTLCRLLGVQMTQLTNYRFSHPLHLSLRPGTRSSPGEWTSNPSFLDWTMGWPIGWSDPMRPVTEWSLWLLRMRGALCELPLADDEAE